MDKDTIEIYAWIKFQLQYNFMRKLDPSDYEGQNLSP